MAPAPLALDEKLAELARALEKELVMGWSYLPSLGWRGRMYGGMFWVLNQDDDSGWRGGCWRHINRRGHLFETDLEYISLSLQDGGRNETH